MGRTKGNWSKVVYYIGIQSALLQNWDDNANVVNTGEYYGLVGPGESHVMLGIDTDQSRSTGHHWRPANVGSAQWNLLQSSSCCLQASYLWVLWEDVTLTADVIQSWTPSALTSKSPSRMSAWQPAMAPMCCTKGSVGNRSGAVGHVANATSTGTLSAPHMVSRTPTLVGPSAGESVMNMESVEMNYSTIGFSTKTIY